MLNYLKFATYQIFGFSCSIPKLNKINKNPDNFTNKEIYDFLHKQAKKSLKLVNINLTILIFSLEQPKLKNNWLFSIVFIFFALFLSLNLKKLSDKKSSTKSNWF